MLFNRGVEPDELLHSRSRGRAPRPWWTRLARRAGEAYGSWQRSRDVDGIVKVLDTLTDRQLALLGVDRLFLRERVREVAERNAAQRAALADAEAWPSAPRDADYDDVPSVDFTVVDSGYRRSMAARQRPAHVH